MKRPCPVILFILFFLHATAALQAAEPATCTWEIVTNLYLGIQTEPLSEETRAVYTAEKNPALRMKPDQGLRVKCVLPKSPAERAGVAAGDVIVTCRGMNVSNMNALLCSVRDARPGELIHLGVRRGLVYRNIVVQAAALNAPKVVAQASMRHRDLVVMARLVGLQRRLAKLLAEPVPNLAAIRKVQDEVNELFPSEGRPGHVRLYYDIEGDGGIMVTLFPEQITVSVSQEAELNTYHLRKQGDILPESARELLFR